jgi:hypothetical protein
MTTYNDAAAAESGNGLARIVLDFSAIMKGVVDQAKRPGFTIDGWAPLAKLVAVEEFERVGPFKDAMRWPQYAEFLTRWATSSEWEYSFKRATEVPPLVFLELEERSVVNGRRSVVNSLSVYAFNAAGKVRRLDVYLQREL